MVGNDRSWHNAGMSRSHLSMLHACVLLATLGACRSSTPGPATTTVEPPLANEAGPLAPSEKARAVADAEDGKTVYAAVHLSYHPYATPVAPQWILLQPTDAPAHPVKLQEARPNGSTVTGQPELMSGERSAFDRWVTLVSGAGATPVHLVELVPLGMKWFGGQPQWWLAAPVPKGAKVPASRDESVAIAGRLEGLEVARPRHVERSHLGSFSRHCDAVPELGTLVDHRDPDGFLSCFKDGVRVISVADRSTAAGDERMASFQTIVLANPQLGSASARFQGRFIYLLRRPDELFDMRFVIVDTGADVGGLSIHPLSSLP